MRDKNPADNTVIEKDKSWNAKTAESRLGFINRDSIISEHIPAPMVVYPLGRLYQRLAAAGNHDGLDSSAIWRSNTSQESSIPGIISYEFDPVFAQTADPGFNWQTGSIGDIYINKWTQLRILNNMTQAFQPGDLQAVTIQLMNIKMHVENIRRALRVMQTTTMSSTSGFNSPEALIKALGWSMTEEDMRTHYYQWRDIFNRSIIGNLNNVVWLKDLIPGFHRWESLVSEIYKDTSADTDYCQLAVLRPRRFMRLTMTPDEHGVHVWTFSEYAPILGNVYPWEKTYTAASSNQSAAAVLMFNAYLKLVAEEIKNTFYDDSVMNILATLNAIEQRNMSSQIAVYREDVPYLDLDPEPIKFTWDFKMMLALINATVMDITISDATVNGRTGLMEQSFGVTTMVPAGENPAYYAMGRLAHAGRLLNLPCFGATNADFANATQWTIAPASRDSESTSILKWQDIGTEVIQRATIWTFQRTTDSESGQERIKPMPHPFTQCVPLNTGAFEELGSHAALFTTMAEAPAFFASPLLYGCEQHNNSGTYTIDVTRVVGQLEVLYAPTFEVLRSIHEQWVYNFWGFPVNPANVGTPSFECATNS